MPAPSEKSLRIALVETADYEAAVTDLTTVNKGSEYYDGVNTRVGAFENSNAGYPFMWLVKDAESDANGAPIPNDSIFVRDGYIWLKKKPVTGWTKLIYGAGANPSFVVPQGTRTVSITQASTTNPFYFRIGLHNNVGLPIAKPADTGGNNAQGTPIYNHSLFTEIDEWPPGTEVYLMGATSGQTVVVQFN